MGIIIGATLGGTVQSSIPAGHAQISLQWSTHDNQNLSVTFNLTDGTNSYSVASDAYGMATQLVATGGTYTVSVTYTGEYDVISTRTLKPESREVYIVSFYASGDTVKYIDVTLDATNCPDGSIFTFNGINMSAGQTIKVIEQDTYTGVVTGPNYTGPATGPVCKPLTEVISRNGSSALTWTPAAPEGINTRIYESGILGLPKGTYAIFAIGGGGGGTYMISNSSTYYSGGSAGSYASANAVSVTDTDILVSIGRGGRAGSKGIEPGDGGDTTILTIAATGGIASSPKSSSAAYPSSTAIPDSVKTEFGIVVPYDVSPYYYEGGLGIGKPGESVYAALTSTSMVNDTAINGTLGSGGATSGTSNVNCIGGMGGDGLVIIRWIGN